MIIRLIVNGTVRIMRAGKAEAVRVSRMARKHNLSLAVYPDHMANEALSSCAAGYDVACNTMPARFIPSDETQAKEKETAEAVGHILAAL